MAEHPNARLIHESLRALNDGDTDALRALWSDDIVWRVKGPSPWHGDIRGADAIFEYLAEFGEVVSDGMHIDIEDVMVGDERAAIVVSIKAEMDGRPLDTSYVLLARIAAQRVHEVITIPFDADRLAEFWQDRMQAQA